MASLRLLVLAFVREYFARWGASPSYSEIAAGLGTNRERVRKAVKRLVAGGLLLRTPGPRGLALPDDCGEALRQLRAAGWQIDVGKRSVTKRPLQRVPRLDYPTTATVGGDENGQSGAGTEEGS